VRDADLALAAAKVEVEDAGRAVTDGYAAEDQEAVRAAREREQSAVEKLEDAQHRLDGAVVRLEGVEAELRTFESERAPELLAEAEDAAHETTADLQRAAHEAVRLWREYKENRNAIQQLVNRIEPGAGQVNGPPAKLCLGVGAHRTRARTPRRRRPRAAAASLARQGLAPAGGRGGQAPPQRAARRGYGLTCRSSRAPAAARWYR
jgi:hypothetical protein